LFGVVGGLLFLSVGASWSARALHSGPALVIGEDGVAGSALLGGLFGSGVGDGLDWSEIAGTEAGSHGSIIISLTDPSAFWARQGVVARTVGWSPFRKGWLGVGGNDLRADRADVLALLRHHALADRRAAPDKQLDKHWIAFHRGPTPWSGPRSGSGIATTRGLNYLLASLESPRTTRHRSACWRSAGSLEWRTRTLVVLAACAGSAREKIRGSGRTRALF